ncbi:MAG: DEAD/DEAH box helicase [Bacteroidia bacterium]
MTTFSALGLKPELAKAVADLGFTQPTPIQQQAIPALLENPGDLIGLARTGTGKTAAFGLPLLHYINAEEKFPQALVLCPTRELCLQISEDLISFAANMRNVHILPVYGGASIGIQIKELKRGVQVIVGTPGRLIDLIERGALKLSEVRTVVLDEADEMLNMGFREDIDTILAETPDSKRTWLFSATMPDGVARIARNYMSSPITVSVQGTHDSDGEITHCYSVVNSRDRYPALRRFIDAHPGLYGIIFCRTKAETQDVAGMLIRDGYSADALHGDLSQAQRDFVMKRFRSKVLQLLVATDVAARGIDVNDVTHVFHYQLPDEPESYTHRSGRTGRAGKDGVSILLIGPRDTGKLREMEKKTGKKLMYIPVPSGDDILKNQVLAFANKIKSSESEINVDERYFSLFFEALEGISAEEALRRLTAIDLRKIIDASAGTDDLNFDPKKLKEPKERKTEEGVRHTFFVGIGRMDRIEAGQLLRIFCEQLNVPGSKIGRIDLKHNFSFVQTINMNPAKVEDAFKRYTHNGRQVRVNLAENVGEGKSGGRERERERGRESRSFGGDRDKKRDRKGYGEKKSFGKDDFSGKKKSKSDQYGDNNYSSRSKADSWQSLMGESQEMERSSKFKKKK